MPWLAASSVGTKLSVPSTLPRSHSIRAWGSSNTIRARASVHVRRFEAAYSSVGDFDLAEFQVQVEPIGYY